MIGSGQGRARPWPIHGFAALLAGLALFHLVQGLADIGAQQQAYEAVYPGVPWNQDWTIVATSAWFTIELIPAVLVWLFASRFARWLLAAMVLLGAGQLLLASVPATPAGMMTLALRMFALGLLLLPAAQPWFGQGREGDALAR
ncbi:MAG: hypothetical protein ACO25F_03900 [Erythrobacter sp.]